MQFPHRRTHFPARLALGLEKKLIQKYIKNIKNIYINYIHIARDRSIWKTKFECRKIKKKLGNEKNERCIVDIVQFI